MLETYNAATDIHGGTEESDKAVAVGLVETLDTKFSKNLVCSLVSKKPKLAKQVASTFHRLSVKCMIIVMITYLKVCQFITAWVSWAKGSTWKYAIPFHLRRLYPRGKKLHA